MNNLKYILSGNKKAPIKYIKTGCDLYIEEICCELNGHSNQHDALVDMNAELVEALEGCLSDLLMHQGEKKGSGTCWAGEAEEALSKAKELSQ